MSREEAQAVAGLALRHLADDAQRLARFFELTGLDPATIREAAARPEFSGAVLDHVLADESLLLDFTARAGLAPEAPARARAALAEAGA